MIIPSFATARHEGDGCLEAKD